jgi:hypothetical protein
MQARRHVRARLGFYRHLATYAAVIGAVLFVDLITGGGISGPVRWLVGFGAQSSAGSSSTPSSFRRSGAARPKSA